MKPRIRKEPDRLSPLRELIENVNYVISEKHVWCPHPYDVVKGLPQMVFDASNAVNDISIFYQFGNADQTLI